MHQEKRELRKRVRRRLSALSDAQIFEQSYAACLKLFQQPAWREAQSVMLYMALPGELDPIHALIEALRMGKQVSVPRCRSDQSQLMDAVRIDTLNFARADSQYGLQEPARGEIVPSQDLDLILVPGLAFDEHGGRLGRGAGFYDRYLHGVGAKTVLVGFAFEDQVTAQLPMEDHDHHMPFLVTPRRVLRAEP